MDILKLAELITDKPNENKPKKYKATAYIERCLRGAVDGIDTDDVALLDEFVWDNCQSGYTCEVVYAETGKRKVFYAENFNNNTEVLYDLLQS
jgi:hypothetical protein